MTTYVALLRAINLGGRNKIGMAELRDLFTAVGHTDVRTYLQSGNVIFDSLANDSVRLAGEIETRIASDLGVTVTVLLRTTDELSHVVSNNPFLTQVSDPVKLHVAFLSTAPEPERVAAFTVPSGDPEEFSVAGREIYLHYPEGAGRSKLNNAYMERRLAVSATSRNWNTVTKIFEMAK